MAVINRIAGLADEMTAWRRHIHENPELGRDCHQTAAFVVERLKEFGITDITTGWAESGVVAVIEGQGDGPTIGLRADMDALPILEETGLDYASKVPGKMHACGHDGHTAMLLGAAKYLSETRNFAGRAVLLFQPDEEGGGGGEVMVQEGVMDKYAIDEVYGIHNGPGLPTGMIGTAPGPLMAAADSFYIDIQGSGGHGAEPHETVDPVVAAVSIVQAFQTIVSRNNDAQKRLVISVTQINTGTASNIIPDTARICGTVRCFDAEVRDMVERRMGEIVAGQAASFGVEAVLDYDRGYPPTVNDVDKARFAAEVARDVVGADQVEGNARPIMAAEDFSYMLEARPGAYAFVGNGVEGATVHHPKYDFNDEIAPVGASFLARLVEKAAPL
ncbi:M20 aminoacylase family protein [Alisedimentitalea sp. MJ-SS2]|uniref:M20 aminoacylase family protein n=1 Tax=Aliisedimentitalea sp. MJ-SS2 TaxID=3049795 RepID=UPI002914F47B|nr:M20 aminoacylase family protein [Alisedimentitalea sp. MJ-SS2]MDU8926551.1 M20 aminoacylase family protein [Alisedimentitalea sp. MJ-SS2]